VLGNQVLRFIKINSRLVDDKTLRSLNHSVFLQLVKCRNRCTHNLRYDLQQQLFNPETGFMQAKDTEGNFRPDFLDIRWGKDYRSLNHSVFLQLVKCRNRCTHNLRYDLQIHDRLKEQP
jgi:hypothetical protein